MLEQITESFLKAAGLWQTGARLVVAVSGGVDSAALLHVLASLRRDGRFSLYAAHLDHGLRPESAEDAASVRALAETLQVPCTIGRTKADSWTRGESVEMAARRIRRAFLLGVRNALSADLVLTAHHGDDQLETVLLRLIRGTSPAGLAGIRPVKDGIGHPFLKASRAEIETYAAEHELPVREDATNRSDAYERNRIRHRTVPELRELNPRVLQAVGRLTELLRSDDEYIMTQVSGALSHIERLPFGARWKWEELHPAPAGRVMVALMDTAGMTELDSDDIRNLMNLSPGASVQLTESYTARRDTEYLWVIRLPSASVWSLPLLPVTGEIETPAGRFRVSVTDKRGEDTPWRQHFDRDRFPEAVVRTRRTGDKVALLGSSGSQTLKKALNARHVPKEFRDFLPVLAADERILWVPGANLMDRELSITKETKQFLLIEFFGEVQTYGTYS